MIVQLTGYLLARQLPYAVIEVSGIGYEVEFPQSCWYALPELGERITVYTRFIVREDAQLLFGFVSKEKRDLFNELLRVSGVGPKLALAILADLPVSQLVRIVQQKEIASLVKLKGVVAKVAQRIVMDLHERLLSWQSAEVASVSPVRDEALAALMALGYSANQAEKAVDAVDEAQDTQTLLRLALQKIG